MGGTRGGRRCCPLGWSSVTRRFAHSRLGGVTNGWFTIGYAFRGGAASLKVDTSSGDSFPNYLRQIWKPTISGRRVSIPGPEDDTENTVMGLLNWKYRESVMVKGPTVFSKTHWVVRKLSRRELANALDMPADIYEKSSEKWQELIGAQKVPGKVLAQALRVLQWYNDDDDCGISSKPSSEAHDMSNDNPLDLIDPRVTAIGGEERCHPIDQLGLDGQKRKRIMEMRRDGDIHLIQRGHEGNKRVRFNEPSVEYPIIKEGETFTEIINVSFLKEGKTGATVSDKAVKSDNAEVPSELWDRRLVSGTWVKHGLQDNRVSPQEVVKALATLRKWLLRQWKISVHKSFLSWLRRSTHASLDERRAVIDAGVTALAYVESSGWWEWTGGSGVLFWRWPEAYQKEMREGVTPYFVGAPPSSMERQPPYKSSTIRQQVLDKVGLVIRKGYIEKLRVGDQVKSLMYMFHVPKGLDDVRMVYDGSKSGLNEALFAPWFYIHSVEMMCRSLLPGYWCGDNDYGEQFLNFNLHPALQQYCGVDLTQLENVGGNTSEGGKEMLGRWTRCAMGLRPSPYVAVKGALIARRLILGNRHDETNPFAWAYIGLNQPGDPDYKANLPWLMLLRKDGSLASAVCQYIDDLRTCAKDEETAWLASGRIAKTLSWLGLQDAARKRREPSQEPGAWSGATVKTTGGDVYQSVTIERWTKTQKHIRWLASCVGLSDDISLKILEPAELALLNTRSMKSEICRKQLESCRGFLVYVSNTYRAMIPFLKGIHLTVDSWRDNRDVDGWKLAYGLRKLIPVDHDPSSTPPPTKVKAAERLESDLRVLMDFTSGAAPPIVPVRPRNTVAMYMVGDASGTGFGGSVWDPKGSGIRASYGGWDETVMEQSSNFREALNLVLMLEHQIDTGRLELGSEVFVFTDNSTAERAFNKGASSSKTLHELVVRIRRLEMMGAIAPRFVWISGQRMIAQGTDGLSRGDLTCGVMSDGVFLKHIPLNKSPFAYNDSLLSEVRTWLPRVEEWTFLTEEDWFDKVFNNPLGKYVWAPSAALARIAIEQLCEVKHIHPYSRHVLFAPALMTNGWRKLIGKQSDVLLTLPVGPVFRGSSVTLIGSVTGNKRCGACGQLIPLHGGVVCANFGHVRLMRMPPCEGSWCGRCYQQSKYDTFPVLSAKDLEDGLIEDEHMVEDDDAMRFREAREGDHLLCTFQCDLCHFVNMQHRLPIPEKTSDDLLLMCIRRANLDAFWSRERSTVGQNRREGIRYAGLCETLGLNIDEAYPSRGPFKVVDSMGMKLACGMLLRSLNPGKNATTIQFDTMRKLRSHLSNYAHTCPDGCGGTFVGEDSHASTLSFAASNTPWFRRFIRGCHRRMGDVWMPDRPVIISELRAALELLEEDWNAFNNDAVGKAQTGLSACLLIAGFFAALRGEEIVRIDAGSMIKHWGESFNYKDAPHVPLMLVGRFKREIGEKVFTQPLAHVSTSGVNIMVWFWRTLDVLVSNGRGAGPLFKNEKGKRASVAELDVMLHTMLIRVQKKWPNIIPDHVRVAEEYSCLRSLRRGATAEAQNAGIPEEIITANNRWRKHCRSRGSLPSMSMMERYTDAKANVKALIRFSGGL